MGVLYFDRNSNLLNQDIKNIQAEDTKSQHMEIECMSNSL